MNFIFVFSKLLTLCFRTKIKLKNKRIKINECASKIHSSITYARYMFIIISSHTHTQRVYSLPVYLTLLQLILI